MKKDNKIIIIGIIAIVAAISFIITMLIISNKNNKEQKDMPYTIYDTWYAKSLKTITKDTTDTIGIEKLFIQLQKDNTKINICYLSEKSKCTLIDCTYDGKAINISNNTSHLNGEYKVEINNDTLELTNINKEENITRVYSFVRYDG